MEWVRRFNTVHESRKECGKIRIGATCRVKRICWTIGSTASVQQATLFNDIKARRQKHAESAGARKGVMQEEAQCNADSSVREGHGD